MDPVTLAVMRGALEQIADEMDLHLIHAALSPIIAETNDCAHGIFHPDTGETIAQGRFGLPVFLANMQFTVQNLLAEIRQGDGFHPGDIWIVNDPYLSGTHLQDVVLVAPHFVGDRMVALLASTGHWMDIGGSVPGGWTPSATEIHQEGILIPPVKTNRSRPAQPAPGADVHRERAAAGTDRRRSLRHDQRVLRRPARPRRSRPALRYRNLAKLYRGDAAALGAADALLHLGNSGRRLSRGRLPRQ